ncbi:transposase IS204/IS1001/IS1096/IS1165 family protein [Dehalogenimonas lykanthroporepellens BL-DC-9]|nr:transposase IS204/IS1001/IS1096/IS1165 family protein [Dehalogenimonas lykanthroporepellens BL-DC-9]
MPNDCIEISLGLPQLEILEQKEMPGQIIVSVKYRRKAVDCPRCGQTTKKPHDYSWQWKQDRKVRDKPVWLKLYKRRFRCLWCQKVFTEPDEVFGSRRRSTQRLRSYMGQTALHQTVRRVALIEQVGEGLVRRCVTEEIGRLLAEEGSILPPEILGVDEFSVKKRHVYNTTVCDLQSRKILGVMEGKGKKNLEVYLNSLSDPERVRAVAMDMHEPFRQAVQLCLPQARIVVDKYHFVWHINQALEKTRSRLQGGRGNTGIRRRLYQNRYALLKSEDKLTEREKATLAELFLHYPEIEKAWQLKEAFKNWYQCKNRGEAEYKLKELEDKINSGPYPEFQKLLCTMNVWRHEILNYFDFRITNAFVEGKNNRIKTLKRLAYGYRNAENFKLRILATNYQDAEVVSRQVV